MAKPYLELTKLQRELVFDMIRNQGYTEGVHTLYQRLMRNIRNIQVKNYEFQIPFISYRKLGEGRRIRKLLSVSIWAQTIDNKPPKKLNYISDA